MSRIAKGLCAAVVVVASTAVAQAQAPDPQGCTPQERGNQALSQDQNRSNGVICPPDIDPTMKAPTPKTGDPSIILPSGTPGGNPNVQPK